MSKRRITTQQQHRIQKKQALHRESGSETDLYSGLVITRFGRHAEIEYADKKRIHCSIRANLQDIVAGDRIVWQKESSEQGVVVSLYPRTSTLSRTDARGQTKPIAANITQVCIVVAEEPRLSWQLLDNYLSMVEFLGLKAILILNKIDIVSEALPQTLQAIYQPLGYPIVLTGINYLEGDEHLTQHLQDEVNIFVGQSGVGKSSIIRRLLPDETEIVTGALSLSTKLGKHTTSHSKYYHLPTGGALIDSPGVREFHLTLLDISDIAKSYVEFKPWIGQCKFRNCTHIETPHCAVIEAVNKGLILKQRYENYVKISKLSR